MQDWIRSLSPRSEFVVVIGLAFGWALLSSLQSVLSGASAQADAAYTFSAADLWSVLIVELTVIAMLGYFLRLRGWTLAHFGPPAQARDLLPALALVAVSIVSFQLLAALALSSGAGLKPAQMTPGVNWILILAASAVNGLYEELFVCGYVLVALRERWGLWPAIHVSTAIRVAYHLYQGSAGVLGIVPMGLIFAGWYARSGRLWPLVLAHALLDAIAFAALS
ncbi:CPBP family intramembrane metalloprotease [Lysobacter sp. 5GHs7-4]|uniref:CPBP family intramembrane glutamic endopeptidase n=1 Tax=Lysobacter sp. 5GHs7-4 TaxID=2904253 RepID=UPI001E64DDB5|nr:CPBP family intramembrane glutamic endopeptidase [Lysobacter sp. 5GHs7-4]UHQ21833.1 CPBP family intramembrane metalloprotease [Lysobacter sp. 5GHs7-4]